MRSERCNAFAGPHPGRTPLTTTAASIQAGRSGGTSTAATPTRFGRRGARALPTEPRRCRFHAKAEVGVPRRLALGRGAPLVGRIESALSADASNTARQDAKAMDRGRRHHVTATVARVVGDDDRSRPSQGRREPGVVSREAGHRDHDGRSARGNRLRGQPRGRTAARRGAGADDRLLGGQHVPLARRIHSRLTIRDLSAPQPGGFAGACLHRLERIGTETSAGGVPIARGWRAGRIERGWGGTARLGRPGRRGGWAGRQRPPGSRCVAGRLSSAWTPKALGREGMRRLARGQARLSRIGLGEGHRLAHRSSPAHKRDNPRREDGDPLRPKRRRQHRLPGDR